MKKYLVLALVILASVSFVFLILTNRNKDSATPSAISKEERDYSENENEEIQYPETKNITDGLKVSWIRTRDKRKLFLYSNLDEKSSSKDLKNKNGCSFLVSGGFYTKENKQIGLFISEGKIIQTEKNSDLFNGFFVLKNNDALIQNSSVMDSRIVLQSGPILFMNEKPLNLTIKNDKKARRNIIAIDSSDNVVFITFYEGKSLISGPELEELPLLIKKVNDEKRLNIVTALNLDGGSASSFITSEIELTEVTRIGSFFCLKSDFIIY